MKEACIVCNSAKTNFVCDVSSLELKYKLIRCLDCGLIFSFPMKSQSDYSQETTHDRWEFDIMLKCLLANGAAFRGMRVFELGCGDGRFLDKLKNLGCDCYGLDINPNGITKAKERGLENVFNTVLNEDFSKRFEKSIDVIFSFHVIEHIDDPQNFIKNIKIMLKPKGFLFLSVPNPERLSGRIFKELWDMPPYHLTKWTQKAIRLLMENNGFKILNFIEEPLSIRSAYIYVVDTHSMITNNFMKLRNIFKKKILTNSLFKGEIIDYKVSKNKLVKKLLHFLIMIISYILGYTIYSFLVFLSLLKILPYKSNKGLSIIAVAKID